MARHFVPRSFLAQVPRGLLVRYFGLRGLADSIPWSRLRPNDVEPIIEVWCSADEGTRLGILDDFRHICALADVNGVLALIEQASLHADRSRLAEQMSHMTSSLEIAFWFFLEQPEVFEAVRAAGCGGHLHYHKRLNMPEMKTEPDGSAHRRLCEELTRYFMRTEGRGQGCKPDYYRNNDDYFWVVYLEDYPESRQVFDEQHSLVPQVFRPTFEVIFAYHRGTRALETRTPGGKRTRNAVQQLFAKAILDADLDDAAQDIVAYDLSRLLDPSFAFPTEPEHGIEQVSVRKLKLQSVDRAHAACTIEPGISSTGQRRTVFDAVSDLTASGEYTREELRVIKATFRFTFRYSGSQDRNLTFTVSYPDSSTLDYDPRSEIARYYLRKWGIEVSGGP